ncbi:hypothetical protein XENOCAPTIV_003072 [Xenoophorus captivus]|uniref:E3 ubiquitin-protein ligase n=1 Tax=Xenoophorus captivus TaxID=1517983 RepID=A0ABV0RYN9_9TELE
MAASLLRRDKRATAAHLKADLTRTDNSSGLRQLQELLDAVLNPEKPAADTDALDWCKCLIAGGEGFEEFCKTVHSYDNATLCGLVWTANFVAYRCRTCGISPCMSLCAERIKMEDSLLARGRGLNLAAVPKKKGHYKSNKPQLCFSFPCQITFTKTFVQHYAFIMKTLMKSHESDTMSNRIVHISVQLFSNEELARHMTEECQLLDIMVTVLLYMMESCLIKSELQGKLTNFTKSVLLF